MYKKITVGYDGSDRAMRAVEHAGDLATGLGASLHIVTAVSEDNVYSHGAGSDQVFVSTTEMAKSRMAKVAKKYPHLEITGAAVVDKPASALVSEAERTNSDAIVVGNKNVQGIGRVLGSVAEAVAHKANCAVLIANTAA